MSSTAEIPGFGRRIAAFALDYLLIGGYLCLLGVVGSLLTFGPVGGAWREFFSDPMRADLVVFVSVVLPVVLYFTLRESSLRGATWGKSRMRLRVVSVGGGRLGRGRALVRSAIKFLPWQLAHTCLFHIPGWPTDPQGPPPWVAVGMALVWVLVGFYVVVLAVRSDRRVPHDWIAGSRVVEAGPRGTSP